MNSVPPGICELLSPRAYQALLEQTSADLREETLISVSTLADVLVVLDRINLDDYELIDLDLPDLTVWEDVNPSVKDAIVAADYAISTLQVAYPTQTIDMREPTSGEFDFALDENVLSGAADPGAFVRRGADVDEIVMAPGDGGVSAILRMLKGDLLRFRSQIRRPEVISSRWALLGELQEFKATATQALEAITAAILRPLVDLPMQDLLPRYRTELDRSLALRDGLLRLASEVESVKQRAQDSDREGCAALRAMVLGKLEKFSHSPASKVLWARDRREIVLVRHALLRWKDDSGSLVELRQTIEGLLRLVEVIAMAVGKRPEVDAYDRETMASDKTAS